MLPAVLIEAFTKIYIPSATVAEMQTAQLLVAHGTEPLRNSGVSNGSILVAEHVSALLARLHLPLVADTSVQQAKPELAITHLTSTAPAQTAALVREVADLCREHGWQRVLIVCTPDEAWFFAALYRKQGLTPLIALTLGSPAAYYNPYTQSWRRRSRLRSLFLFELPRRLSALLHGWI
jgi:hypothetical protein